MITEIPIGKILNDKIIFYDHYADILWNMGFYGEKINNQLILLPFETLYLVERGRIKVYLDNKSISFNELLHYFLKFDPEIWIKYTIYSDLRQKGYIVKGGVGGISFRVYDKGSIVGRDSAKIIVYGITEGRPLKLNELKEMVSSAKSLKKEIVLAIVSGQGEIAYYSVNEVSF
ncbi:MAG: tRNA-intron lyase [Candidatus Methanomethylicia archaeon]|nr:tRNA-intron lyase [Candidatus Methanomethylicia archaeon]MCX8169310.1 tRNA-intron lyase [Candidatus Methanomethylicia archaeon]MDW7988907.1 tRNA-intron lyase [Nitrososphaerota archaeon]